MGLFMNTDQDIGLVGGPMQVGRNDPCPCGSRKKFKKCCLNKTVETGDLLWRQLGSIHDDMAKRLLEHGMRVFGRPAIEEAWEEFWSWENDVSFADAYESEQLKIQLFMPYFLYNWTPDLESEVLETAPADTTIAADFLEKRARNLTELERRFLAASITSPFSFHDVLEVDPGKEFVLKDIFLGTEVRVTERMGSQSARVGDIVYGKVIQIDHVGMLCGTGWIMIPPVQKQVILDLRKTMRKVCGEERVEVTANTLQDYDIELREIFLDVQAALLTPPKLANTDGEEFSFHRIIYTIDSPQITFDKLRDLALIEDEAELLEDAERGQDGAIQKTTITWHKRGNALHSSWDNTVMGRLFIDGNTLTIEVNSENRAKRIRKEVEKRLKGHAKYKSTVLQSPESMMRERDEFRAPDANANHKQDDQELMSHPEIKAQLQEMMKKHWESWFHEKISALGNKTPVQASKTSDGREMLEALLLDYQRHDERSNQLYKPDYDQICKRLFAKEKKSTAPKKRCGLCGSTKKKLTKTECCGNWICDDEADYVVFSYARNSCNRNHRRFTLCGYHHTEEHPGRWQDCSTCRDDFETELYVHNGTNEYNFEKLLNPPKFDPTCCAKCKTVINLGEDGYSMKGNKYYCDQCGPQLSAGIF